MVLLLYYRQCIVNGKQITVGNHVLINNCDDPQNVNGAYVATIIDMYDTGNVNNLIFIISINKNKYNHFVRKELLSDIISYLTVFVTKIDSTFNMGKWVIMNSFRRNSES